MSNDRSIKEPILETLKSTETTLKSVDKAITHLQIELTNFLPPGTLPSRWNPTVARAKELLAGHQSRINILIKILGSSDVNEALSKANREGHRWLVAKGEIELVEISTAIVLATIESKMRIGMAIAAEYAPTAIVKFQKVLRHLKLVRGLVPVLLIAAEACSLIHSLRVGDKYGVITSGTGVALGIVDTALMGSSMGAINTASSVVLSVGGAVYVGEKVGDFIRDLRLEKEIKTLLRLAEIAVVANGELGYYYEAYFSPSKTPNFKELELLEKCLQVRVGRSYNSLFALAKTLKFSADIKGKHRATINKLFTEVTAATSAGLEKTSLWPLQQSLVSQVIKTTIEIVADHYVRMGTVPKNKRQTVVAKLRGALTFRLNFNQTVVVRGQ